MIGAIIGDIVGSRFEWNNIKTKDFQLFTSSSRPTDDTVMTLAIAKAIMGCRGDYEKLEEASVKAMKKLGNMYQDAGYGGRFKAWLKEENPLPYQSFGNGAAMRVSPAGFIANSLKEAGSLATMVTKVTHDHPEGLKAAKAVAEAIYLGRSGSSLTEIKEYVNANYYILDFTLDEIRPSYKFDVSCQGSVPQAFLAFFESTSFEDAIRNAISIGGDSDTIAAITGALAQSYYGVPADIKEKTMAYLDEYMREILREWEETLTMNEYGKEKN